MSDQTDVRVRAEQWARLIESFDGEFSNKVYLWMAQQGAAIIRDLLQPLHTDDQRVVDVMGTDHGQPCREYGCQYLKMEQKIAELIPFTEDPYETPCKSIDRYKI